MSAPAPSSAAAPAPATPPTRALSPISRAALRYTISPYEYALLHKYVLSRTSATEKSLPAPQRYERITRARTETGEYNTASFRAALRVFAASYAGFSAYEKLTVTLERRRRGPTWNPPQSVKNKTARIALSFSGIMLFHRLLHRFFKRLRAELLDSNAKSFRERNPTIARLLTSQYTPAAGASLAGLFLGISPADQLRLTIVIYAFSRGLEFGYNALSESGYLWKEGEKPWWFGSWLIMPFTCGQLLHAFVFDREDCFPEAYGRFILARSPEYIQLRPADYPKSAPWPGTFEIVDALAELSKLRWPDFVSPILFPAIKQKFTPALLKISPIIAPAHPAILHTSCAVLHPNDPSCMRTYVKYWLAAFPAMARFFTVIYGAFALLAYKSAIKAPLPFFNKLSQRILQITIFLTGAIGTSWGSICLFNNYMGRSMLPTQRWFLGGFLGGMWAFVARNNERSTFLYSLRASMDSTWKVGKKHGWWRGVANGDVFVFVASLALINVVYEARPTAISGGALRKGLSSLRGEGFVDRSVPVADNAKEKESVKLE